MTYIQEDIFGQGTTSRRIVPRTPPLSRQDRHEIAGCMTAKAAGLLKSPFPVEKRRGEKLMDEAGRYAVCREHDTTWHCPNDNHLFRTPVTCHSRICEPCSFVYFRQIEKSMEKVIAPLFSKRQKGYGVYLLTLTTDTKRYQGAKPTREHIKRLYDESTKLLRLYYGKYQARITKNGKVIEDQRHVTWQDDGTGKKKKVRNSYRTRKTKAGKEVEDYRRFRGSGFIATMELGRGNNNLHLHVLVYGPYISVRRISESWKKITGDSFIVDIRAVYKAKAAIWYVMKYIVKPPQVESYNDLADYAEMIKGTRRVRAGGIFYDRIKKQPRPDISFCCPYCKSRLENIGRQLLDTDEKAATPSLYELLRDMAARGAPLPYPGPISTIDSRMDEMCRYNRKLGIRLFDEN